MNEDTFVDINLLATDSDVLPFCVYHYIDTKMGIYRGFISGPSVNLGKDGKMKYICDKPNDISPYGKWILAFSFYAINPMVRPIPKGMGLFCAKKQNVFPWNTSSVRLVYDPFDIDNECVYFIAYTKPAPWTKPLYIHTQGNFYFSSNVFPSWKPNPPVIDKNKGKFVEVKTKLFSTLPAYYWKGSSATELKLHDDMSHKLSWHHSTIFPIYVLSPELFGKEFNKILFECHNANCYPYNHKNDYIQRVAWMNNTNKPQPRKLRDCVIRCNQLVPAELGGDNQFDMISMVNDELASMARESPSLGTKLSKTSPLIISVIIFMFVIALGLLVYYAIHKN